MTCLCAKWRSSTAYPRTPLSAKVKRTVAMSRAPNPKLESDSREWRRSLSLRSGWSRRRAEGPETLGEPRLWFLSIPSYSTQMLACLSYFGRLARRRDLPRRPAHSYGASACSLFPVLKPPARPRRRANPRLFRIEAEGWLAPQHRIGIPSANPRSEITLIARRRFGSLRDHSSQYGWRSTVIRV